MFFESIQWATPSCTIIAGPSNSGKTTLLTKILIHKNQLFTSQNLKTILFFNQEQEIYKSWNDSGLINHSQRGIPSISDFKDLANFYSEGKGAIIIFDDLGNEISNNLDFFENIFVILSHHLNLTVFLVVHNLFEKSLRKISLNTNRFIITANHRDKSQIGFLSRQAFPKSKNFLGSVYNYILTTYPYGYIVLDFSQNRSEYLRISTRWFSKESIMVFTEEKSSCGGDPLKPFRCYHLIADNVFKLLNSNQTQITCGANNINKNSFEISGVEKIDDGYTPNNKILKQTDNLNNQPNENQLGDTNPVLQPKSDNTVTPYSTDINNIHNQPVNSQSDGSTSTQPLNIVKKQIDGVKTSQKMVPSKPSDRHKINVIKNHIDKKKNILKMKPSKPLDKHGIRKTPNKIDKKVFETPPNDKNITSEYVGGDSATTPIPKQNSFKSTSKKIEVQKNKFLRVKQNLFKDKNKLVQRSKPVKTGDSRPVPSFSKIFSKQKKNIIPQDVQHQKKNELAGRVDNQMKPRVRFKPALTGVRKNKNTSIKTINYKPQVSSESVTTQNMNTPKPTHEISNNQSDLAPNRVGVKRKPLKGLRSNVPPKISKFNRGEKREPAPTWNDSQRKKLKKHDIIENTSGYDVWRL